MGLNKINENNKKHKNESKNMSNKNTIKLTESDLKRVISESVKKVLREEATNTNIYDIWDDLLMNVGAETMLNCIYQWSSSDQIEEWIEWFKEEGYIDDEY